MTLNVHFDQGKEIRFMQYVFIPQREGAEPKWIHATNITESGMRIETPVPLAIRTAPIYTKGAVYRIIIRDHAGLTLESLQFKADFNRMLRFTVTPPANAGPLTIEIDKS